MRTTLNQKKIQTFTRAVWAYYRANGRNLPWRKTRDPYKILVSEIMLQQTQVSRVISKYEQWLKLFPTAKALASAPLLDVVRAWQGLGYNRRGLFLQKAVKEIVETYKNKFPKSIEIIDSLPGVGKYTAGAIAAFAFNIPSVLIETNIRSAFLDAFFDDKSCKEVDDRDILPFIEQALGEKRNRENPREWYWALMDYGAMLKTTMENPSRKSKRHTKQSPFKGSNRQARAAILSTISISPLSEKQLAQKLVEKNIKTTPEQIEKSILALQREGFIEKKKLLFAIKS